MNRTKNLEAEFVTAIPQKLESGKIYASIEYATVAHLCCCGCGREVVTPLTPTDWKLTYDGETVSLHPSIGNWSFPCRSHYWVRNGKIRWAEDWSQEQVQAGREQDRRAKACQKSSLAVTPQANDAESNETGIWTKIKRALFG